MLVVPAVNAASSASAVPPEPPPQLMFKSSAFDIAPIRLPLDAR
jgi:hypothetical protein